MSDQQFEEVKADFNEIDLERCGQITSNDLKLFWSRKGESKTQAELEIFMAMLDPNGDGQVTFEEFVKHRAAGLDED